MEPRKPKHIILDSGAFSVWTKGISIDINQYIDFCKQHPLISYYVNLDVIPGIPNKHKTVNKKTTEEAAQKSWENYQRMLEYFPIEKVIPVFHQNEDFKWLNKYIEFGTPYIGISPANDRTTAQKIGWLKQIQKYTNLCDEKGNPKIKIHGFAVTSYRLLKFWHWHSVDSVSWLKNAAYGSILVPPFFKEENYHLKPWTISFSLLSPEIKKKNAHYKNLSPSLKKNLDIYLQKEGLEVGETHIINAPLNSGLKENEFWVVNKNYKRRKEKKIKNNLSLLKPQKVQEGYGKKAIIITEGLCNSYKIRCEANINFINKQEQALGIDNMYFAGSYYEYSYKIRNKLFSYFEFIESKNEILKNILAEYEKDIENEN